MYLDFFVKISENTGRTTVNRRGETTYIEYTYSREYVPEKKYNVPKRTTIGKQSKEDPTMMQPNKNFLKFFPDVELPDIKDRASRSSCLRAGASIIIKKVIDECGLPDMLNRYFDRRELGLLLDFAAYSIICEDNAAQYYPDYAYNHPLFTEDMQFYSDSTVSHFLNRITDDQTIGFLNRWNAERALPLQRDNKDGHPTA